MRKILALALVVLLAGVATALLLRDGTSSELTESLSRVSHDTELLTQECAADFAVIGDYGLSGPGETAVANLVHSWEPDFVVTTGDNNYPAGAAESVDANIGRYYGRYIYPYHGEGEATATVNRFFPSLGNHDWQARGAQPYLDYFTLPGNERYYEVEWGSVHLFVIDSDGSEPDGISATSRQAQWLKDRMSASTLPWQVVAMHHPPYSSSNNHGSSTALQWPFAEWGADVVLAGHDHTYERLNVGGITYVVNGLGGNERYGFGKPLPGSQARFQADYGALKAEATEDQLTLSFLTHDGEVIDSATLNDPQPNAQCGDIPGD